MSYPVALLATGVTIVVDAGIYVGKKINTSKAKKVAVKFTP
ncbi:MULTISPECIES: hypothetical protein [Bacillus cereus group]|nr:MULTISPECIES: hypothetical protein [Bacillus cereus group]MDR4986897.1 hypothetical protein [Bacillus cereus]